MNKHSELGDIYEGTPVERNYVDPEFRCRECRRGYDFTEEEDSSTVHYWDCICGERVGTNWEYHVKGGILELEGRE